MSKSKTSISNLAISVHGGFPFSTDHKCKYYDKCQKGQRPWKDGECCIDWATRKKKDGSLIL